MTSKKRPPSEIKGIVQLNGLQYLVVELPRPTSRKTKGGIHVVDSEENKEEWARYGRIVVDGDGSSKPDGNHHDCKYHVGQLVLMDRFTAQTVIRGVHVRMVPELHIIAVVDDGLIEPDDDWRPGS